MSNRGYLKEDADNPCKEVALETSEVTASMTLTKDVTFKVKSLRPLTKESIEQAFVLFWNKYYGLEADLVKVMLTANIDGKEEVFYPDEQELSI